jgi:putative protein-disulfide isomerase
MSTSESASRNRKITVYHATAPSCWWSWGYEAVLNRLALVYGDQIDVQLMIGTVYDNLPEWLKQYGLTEESWRKWARESSKLMGIPIRTDYSVSKEPHSVVKASQAVLAAQRQGDRKKVSRFMRELLRLFVVEGKDITQSNLLMEAAGISQLDTKKFTKDLENSKARQEELEHQGHGFPEVSLGFYNLVVSDGIGRTVLLDNAFEPEIVEGAIDYLSDRKLRKASPSDIGEYLEEHGPAPIVELTRVFAISENRATEKLSLLERKGRIERVTLAGAPHWHRL